MVRSVWTISATGGHLYSHTKELPKKALQKAAETTFSEEDLNDIFHAANHYGLELAFHEQGARTKAVQELRDSLLKHAKAICTLADKFQPLGNDQVIETDRATMNALSLLYSAPNISLRDEFHRTASTAGGLVRLLSTDPAQGGEASGMISQRKPEVAALREYISYVRLMAQPEQARSRQTGALEFKRWGMTVGPNGRSFLKFSSILLKRPVSKNEFEAADPGPPPWL